MAALCPGVQYGLSSQENFGENKDLIFVKLTDSALRAIEEYLKNKHKFSYKENPSIKFLGNEGHLAFPSIHNGGTTSFKFSVSSTSDMEGPGGSFECIQQTGPSRNKLEALGSIPFKMRIHANDDVYAATKQRMTVAEENHKNKCTREIKPNQTDIGRKVKLKQNIRQSLIPARSRDPPPTNNTNSNNDGPIKNSYLSSNSVSSKTLVSNSSSSNHSNGYTNGYSSSNNYNNGNSFRPHQNKPSVPDIARRPLKERLIHLLALRPHNKMELHERLTKEGLREKSSMTSVLKQIANMKGNYFYLNRSMCNDVNEDWPFYTESEKQTLKRRKPQNLSPPDSSDSGSSGSGRSPTSTHPGSPPPITASAQKRPGYYDGADGLPTKRPRISHCKPSEQLSPAEHNTLRRPITDSRDASNMNPRSRESPVPPYGMMLNDNITNGPKRNGMNGNESEDFSFTNNTNGKINGKINGTRYSPVKPEPLMPRKDTMENRNGYSSNKRGYLDYDAPPDVIVREKISPDSQRRATPSPVEVASNTLPDYLTEYTTIKNGEQRRTYKADFNANYAEYKSLHGTVEKVSRRFAELEERLKQEDSSSPRYKDIKRQIVKEYQENKKNKIHQTSKQRFQYLHDKLSHIKRLVMEYDQAVMDSQD